MYKEMRRKDRQASREQAEEVLAAGMYGVLSMNGADQPYGIPLSHVWLKGAVYFHCAAEGSKLERLRADNRVSYCVVSEAAPLPAEYSMKYRSAIVSGKAAEVTDDAEKLEALIALVRKYSGETYVKPGGDRAAAALGRTLVYRIDPVRITGKIRK